VEAETDRQNKKTKIGGKKMKKTLLLLAGATLLAFGAVQPAAAQTVVTYNWGGIHMMPDQVLSLNFRLEQAAVPVTLPVMLTLEDKKGNILYQKVMNVTSGQTATWTVGWNAAPGGGSFDHYIDPQYLAQISQNVSMVVPIFRVVTPTPPQPYIDMITPTLEVIDMSGQYRVTSYLNNPHMTLSVLRQ
jgi:hypothetical protein